MEEFNRRDVGVHERWTYGREIGRGRDARDVREDTQREREATRHGVWTNDGRWVGRFEKNPRKRAARDIDARTGEWASVGVRIVQIIILLVMVNLHITAHLVHEIGFGVVDSGDVSARAPRVG